MSRADQLDFIDRVERGVNQRTPKLDAIAAKLRTLLDGRREKIRALGTGKLENFYENYFPHIWKDSRKARDVIGQIFGKKSLQGKASFLKHRTIMTTKEGIAKGLEPVSDNPIDLVLLKVYEMDRYMMAQNIIGDLRSRNMIKFKYATAQVSDGYAEINDYAYTVFMPPEITVEEAYDKLLVENLEQFAKSMGIDTLRLMKMGKNKWGDQQGDKVRTRFAGPESVLIHEIGHVLGNRYNLFKLMTNDAETSKRNILKAQLRALADQRVKGQQVSDHHRKYVRKAQEKEAVLLEAYIHAPDVFKKVAPDVFNKFKRFLNSHAELRPLLDVSASLVMGTGEGKIKVPGVTELGKFTAPEPVARLINNYLSPGLRTNENELISGAYNAARGLGNVMNQINLAMSLFHGLNTTTDVMASHVGLGLRQMFATSGQFWSGVGNVVTAPIQPLPNLWRGHKLMKEYKKDLEKIEDPKLKGMVEMIIAGGGRAKMDSFYHVNGIEAITQSFRDIMKGTLKQKAIGTVTLPTRTFMAAVELIAKPVLEFLVPRQKLGLFLKMAEHEMKRAERGTITDEQLMERLTSSWDSVDNRMGQLVYDNLFWNKTLKDAAMLAVRSVGWNLGSWREYGGTATDIISTVGRVKRGDAWLSQKMGYTAGAVITYAVLGAVIQKILTGDEPEEMKDYFFPKTGKRNPDGSIERISLPTYAKDWFSYAKHPLTTISHKAHPMWQMMYESLISNEDFFGTEIRHKDDPVVQQLIDVAEYVGKSFLPFSVKNYFKMTKAGHAPGKAAATSFSGIAAAPASVSRTPAHELMVDKIVARIPQGARTKAQYEKSQVKKDARNRIRKGENIYEIAGITEILTSREIARLVKDAKEDPIAYSYKRLTLREALDVYAIATPFERKIMLPVLQGKLRRANRRRDDYKDNKKLFDMLVKLR